MALPDSYLSALDLLGQVFFAYHEATGGSAILVGGAATAIYTNGAFMSGDFDIIAGRDEVFSDLMTEFGFAKEDRAGYLRVGH